jgi:hypothetical protein
MEIREIRETQEIPKVFRVPIAKFRWPVCVSTMVEAVEAVEAVRIRPMD